MIPEWFSDLAVITGFVASICICILLVIEANVLIRLLPLIKESANNTKRVANTFEHGEQAIKNFAPKILERYQIRSNKPLCNVEDPRHIHLASCFN